MIPTRQVDPREPALGFLVSGVLADGFYLAGRLAVQLSPGNAALGLLGIFWLLFMSISLIVGTVWVRRCWANAEVLTPGSQPFRRGWTTVGWMVPGLSVWMRWRILLGLWRTGSGLGTPLLVHLGVGSSLAYNLTNIAVRIWNLGTAGVLVNSVIGLAHIALSITIVRRITSSQVGTLQPSAAPKATGAHDHDEAVLPAPQ